MKRLLLLLLSVSSFAAAHQMTPTYPHLERSIVSGVLKTQVEIINQRQDVEYYEIGVFDNQWKPVTFATPSRLVRLPYLSRAKVDVYIREKDLGIATYVCSLSKIQSKVESAAIVYSRICSKLK